MQAASAHSLGREDECELMLRRWAKAKTGDGQIILLSGEAGIGKSRLTAAFLEELTTEPYTRLRYFCSPQHEDSAFFPIIGQLERAAGFAHEDDAQSKLEKLDVVLAATATLARGCGVDRGPAVAPRRRSSSDLNVGAGAASSEDDGGPGNADRHADAYASGPDDLRGRALGRSVEPGIARPPCRSDRARTSADACHITAGIHCALDRQAERHGYDHQSSDADRGSLR